MHSAAYAGTSCVVKECLEGMSIEKLVTVARAAETLSISQFTIRRLIDSGDLRAVRIRGRVLVPRVEVERVATHGVGSRPRDERAKTRK